MNQDADNSTQQDSASAAYQNMPVWKDPDYQFPSPMDGSYGFLTEHGWQRCAPPELLDVLRNDVGLSIPLVWTPETPRLTPPAEVPYLFPAVKERLIKMIWRRLRRTLLIGSLIAIVVFPLLLQDGLERQFGLVVITAIFLIPLLHGIWSLHRARRLTPESAMEHGELARLGLWLGSRPWQSTKFLLKWILVVGVAQLLFAMLVSRDSAAGTSSVTELALIKDRVLEGEFWRLLTAFMGHGNVIHIGFNYFALKVLGRQLEGFTHAAYIPIIFLVSALIGCGFSLAVLETSHGAGSIGASGGVIGLIGFMAVLFVRHRSQLPRGLILETFENIGLIAIIGMVGFQVIDNAGHFGGLLGGVLLGILMRSGRLNLPLYPRKSTRMLGKVCSGVVVLAAVLAILRLLMVSV